MLRHQGGDFVKAGFYLNLDSWEIHTLTEREGGILEGGAGSRYLRVPVALMLLFAPLMGAMFAIFLPFIGIYLIAQYALGKGWLGIRHATRAMVLALGPSWQPAAAHLTDEAQGPAPAQVDDNNEKALAELEKDIEEAERR